jgi:subtilase family serine protease
VPDLVASAYQYSPQPALKGQTAYIQVTVKNSGSAPAGGFTVSWYSNQTTPGCDWSVQGLGIGKSKNLECEFTYNKAHSGYWVSFIVDSGNQVAESNEGNNGRDWKWQVK